MAFNRLAGCQALGGQDRPGAVRIVGDQAVDAHVDQRAISAGLFTVQGSTFRPIAWASLTFAAVTLRQNGDQTAQPAALANDGTEPPWAAEIESGQPRRRPCTAPADRVHAAALDREATGRRSRARDGAPRSAPASRRIGSCCARPALPRRIASTASWAKRSGSTVRSGLVGIGLDLDVEAHLRSCHRKKLRQGREAFAVDRLLLGELLRIFGRRIEPADVVALELGQGQRADSGRCRRSICRRVRAPGRD